MLRYAGGKQRAIQTLDAYVPDVTEIISPFMGGCSFELSLAKKGIKVYCNDIVQPLVNYFQQQQTNQTDLLSCIQGYLPITKEKFHESKRTLREGSNVEQAAKFFVLNRSCFSGCITGGFSGTRFTESCIKPLDLTNMEFSNMDYIDFLNAHPDTFAYLDPPYDVPNLYASPKFDHVRLANTLRNRQNWFMSYNDTPLIRELYETWCSIETVSWVYGMSKVKQSNEVIIRPVIPIFTQPK